MRLLPLFLDSTPILAFLELRLDIQVIFFDISFNCLPLEFLHKYVLSRVFLFLMLIQLYANLCCRFLKVFYLGFKGL